MRHLPFAALLLASVALGQGRAPFGSYTDIQAEAASGWYNDGGSTATQERVEMGPSPISADAGVTLVNSNITINGTDKGVFFVHGEAILGDSAGLYIPNVGTRTLQCASGAGCFLGTSSRRFGNLFVDSVNGGSTGTVVVDGVKLGAAPSIASACTSPTVTHGATVSFQVDVGTSCTGVSTIVLTLVASTNGWICSGWSLNSPSTRYINQTAGSTTSVTLTNFARTTGLASDFADGADLAIGCTPR